MFLQIPMPPLVLGDSFFWGADGTCHRSQCRMPLNCTFHSEQRRHCSHRDYSLLNRPPWVHSGEPSLKTEENAKKQLQSTEKKEEGN